MANIKNHLWVILAGLVVGAASVLLVANGNPGNMGFCIACFLRDIAGGVGMHRAAVVQYIRPEVIGLVLGAFIMALCGKEFKVRGGSAPLTRFVLGFFVMIGALVFLGCPLRMMIRMGGGDLNAIIALLGFIAGIWVGTLFLKKGYSLRKSNPQPAVEGFGMIAIMLALLALVIAAPAFIFFSEKGPGSMRAPLALALIVGLVVGALAQRSRLCMAGGIRDAILLKDFHLLMGFAAIFVAVLVGNLIVGKVNVGFTGQPIAHAVHVWNFLGMVLVGIGSVLLGGCPLRQLILAGSGNSDSSVAVLGMIVGAACAHNFGLAGAAASADAIGGPSLAGKAAVVIGIVVVLVIGVMNTKKVEA